MINFYLLIVGKKDGFEVVVVDRGVVVRGVDGVVEVVDEGFTTRYASSSSSL
jgi:hypothetical protein